MKNKPLLVIYQVLVSWVSDGEVITNHHGAYTTLNKAKEVESNLKCKYSDDYGEHYWDSNDLISEVTQLEVYE